MNTCTHDRHWSYDPVAHRIRCADCGGLVRADKAVEKFNATRQVGSDLIAAAWQEVDRLRQIENKLRVELATMILEAGRHE
jgi:ribosomal protein S26